MIQKIIDSYIEYLSLKIKLKVIILKKVNLSFYNSNLKMKTFKMLSIISILK